MKNGFGMTEMDLIGRRANYANDDILLPCPFCGDKAYLDSDEKDRYRVGCATIGCIGHVCTSDYWGTEGKVRKAWNKRNERRADDLSSTGVPGSIGRIGEHSTGRH